MSVIDITKIGKPDLAQKVYAPFPIYSLKELDKYFSLSHRSFIIPKCLDMGALDSVNLKRRVKELSDKLGWGKFIGLTHPVFKKLTLEFYTTLRLSDQAHKKFECRLNGKPIVIDYDTMDKVFGLSKGGLYEPPIKYKPREFWKEITS